MANSEALALLEEALEARQKSPDAAIKMQEDESERSRLQAELDSAHATAVNKAFLRDNVGEGQSGDSGFLQVDKVTSYFLKVNVPADGKTRASVRLIAGSVYGQFTTVATLTGEEGKVVLKDTNGQPVRRLKEMKLKVGPIARIISKIPAH